MASYRSALVRMGIPAGEELSNTACLAAFAIAPLGNLPPFYVRSLRSPFFESFFCLSNRWKFCIAG